MAVRLPLAILSTILQFIVFLFTVVATPLDAFRAKDKIDDVRYCYSMWGYKRCGPHKRSSGLANKGFPCSSSKKTMDAAAAFAIISIFFTLVAFILALVVMLKLMRGFAAGAVFVLAAIFTLISWACMAGAYHKKCSGTTKLSESYNYGAAFGLMVTAWCLQVVVCVFIFFA